MEDVFLNVAQMTSATIMSAIQEEVKRQLEAEVRVNDRRIELLKTGMQEEGLRFEALIKQLTSRCDEIGARCDELGTTLGFLANACAAVAPTADVGCTSLPSPRAALPMQPSSPVPSIVTEAPEVEEPEPASAPLAPPAPPEPAPLTPHLQTALPMKVPPRPYAGEVATKCLAVKMPPPVVMNRMLAAGLRPPPPAPTPLPNSEPPPPKPQPPPPTVPHPLGPGPRAILQGHQVAAAEVIYKAPPSFPPPHSPNAGLMPPPATAGEPPGEAKAVAPSKKPPPMLPKTC